MSEFEPYFSSIGLEGAYLARAELAVNTIENIYGEDYVKDVLVSEYVQEDGRRIYESVNCFVETLAYHEFKGFLTEVHFDWAPLKVEWWDLALRDYALGDTGLIESRGTLNVRIVGGNEGIFKASGTNCEQLGEILNKYVIPGQIS